MPKILGNKTFVTMIFIFKYVKDNYVEDTAVLI